MSLLKKNIKLIIGIIIGVILASGITVYAYSYFADDIEYSRQGRNDIDSVEDALNDLYSKSKSITLLWTNANPTSDFADQTLNFDLSKFNYVLIKSKRAKGDVSGSDGSLGPEYAIIPVGESGKIMGIDNNYAYHYMRDVQVTTTGITFSKAYRRGYKLSNADNMIDDAIPLNIYGIKY